MGANSVEASGQHDLGADLPLDSLYGTMMVHDARHDGFIPLSYPAPLLLVDFLVNGRGCHGCHTQLVVGVAC